MKRNFNRERNCKRRKLYFEWSIFFLLFGFINYTSYQQYAKELSKKEQERLYRLLKKYKEISGSRLIGYLSVGLGIIIGVILLGGCKFILESCKLLIEPTPEKEMMFNNRVMFGVSIIVLTLFIVIRLGCFDFSMGLKYYALKSIVEKGDSNV